MRPKGCTALRKVFGPGACWWAASVTVLLGLLLVRGVFGQAPEGPKAEAPEPSAAGKAPEEPKESDEPVYIEHADQVSYDPEKNVYFLTTLPPDQSKGPVHFRHKDTHLYCDQAQYNEEEDTARATGNLRIVQPDTTVTGDLIIADFDQEVAEIIGNVRVVTQRKKRTSADSGQSKEEEQKETRWEEYKQKITTITCQQIRYWYEEKRAIATGGVVAEQEDKRITADEAEYVEKEDLLTLRGNPVVASTKDGDRFTTTWVKVEIEGERFWTGPFVGTFRREKKQEQKSGQQEPAPQPQQPGLPPPPPPP